MRGVSEGFYDTPNVLDDGSCLDQEAIDAMYNMVTGWIHGTSTGDTILKVSSAFYVFINNLARNCRMYQFFYDTVTYCFRSDQCELRHLCLQPRCQSVPDSIVRSTNHRDSHCNVRTANP